jgi:2-keto-4-pentenoate hydratase/2-oxohepta-3-ene-1,7-dioic acid hydratase in catechol pathway
VVDVSGARRYARLELGDGRRLYALLDGGWAHTLSGPPWEGGAPTGIQLEGVDAEGRGASVKRLCPVTPSKIVCVGRNYKAHASELGN